MAGMDLSDIARDMRKIIPQTSNRKVVVSPLLTKNQAEKLYGELRDYNGLVGPLNPDLGDASSYGVIFPGMKDEDDASYGIVEDVLNKVEKTNLSGIEHRIPGGEDSYKVKKELESRGYKVWGPTEKNTIHIPRNGGIKNA